MKLSLGLTVFAVSIFLGNCQVDTNHRTAVQSMLKTGIIKQLEIMAAKGKKYNKEEADYILRDIVYKEMVKTRDMMLRLGFRDPIITPELVTDIVGSKEVHRSFKKLLPADAEQSYIGSVFRRIIKFAKDIVNKIFQRFQSN